MLEQRWTQHLDDVVAAVQANASVNGDTSIELYRLAWQALPDDMSGLGRSASVSFRWAGTGCRGLWRTPGRNDVWCAGPRETGRTARSGWRPPTPSDAT
ncbi:hypothetical protein [Saccharothrix sp. NRRL B-16348]|uniref:hypothetical protein n=1 Tax=Saccharothrix sp. NRRL B-16348 TaxID=1415542 RepID=UPI0012F98FA7|nr:hypothetical protein [Saccharothrix sp. NRRL B-16348]